MLRAVRRRIGTKLPWLPIVANIAAGLLELLRVATQPLYCVELSPSDLAPEQPTRRTRGFGEGSPRPAGCR